MLFSGILNKVGEIGVKPYYQPWEKYLTRKINYYTIISISAIVLSIIIYTGIGNFHFIPELTIIFFTAQSVFFFNVRYNYTYALYVFYINAATLVFILSFEMGEDSMIYLFFFPLTISLLTLLNKKEMNIHIRIISGVMFALIFVNISNMHFGWIHGVLKHEELHTVRMINIFFSSFITLMFSLALSKQNSIQEQDLITLIKEKETLLAEVHHRVKNNMAIITSLLNLKKETCNSEETKEVLEDFRNRIFSMALIHKNIYGNNSLKSINFQEYVTELSEVLISAYADKGKVKLSIDVVDCSLYFDVAIPCGFIINELFTNSLKYALKEDEALLINIMMKRSGNNIYLTYSDNGPGLNLNAIDNKTSLGMTLIDLLSQQLEGSYLFSKAAGLFFEMKFPLPKLKVRQNHY
jgi:two-component sensor histidine kinase